jgi:hypothetical protein
LFLLGWGRNNVFYSTVTRVLELIGSGVLDERVAGFQKIKLDNARF